MSTDRWPPAASRGSTYLAVTLRPTGIEDKPFQEAGAAVAERFEDFLLALVFFRSLVAALLPLMVGALTIIGTLLLLRLASEFGSISIYALNGATALGLGLSIDFWDDVDIEP